MASKAGAGEARERGVLGELVNNGKLYRGGGRAGPSSGGEDDGEYLTRLPPYLLGLILEEASAGGDGVRVLASLSCTCRALRKIVSPEHEDVPCDFSGMDDPPAHHHCHLLSTTGYPHSWYFDVDGYVRTDDLHTLTLGGRLWRLQCDRLLGEGFCDLHAVCGAFADDLVRENAPFWRNLCRDAAELRIVHWSRGANLVLKHNAKVEDEVMSRRVELDPEITRAQKLLNGPQTPRCSIPGPCQPCFSGGVVLPYDGQAGRAEEDAAAASSSRAALAPEEIEAAERVLSSKWKKLSSTFTLEKRLPRSGHCAVPAGDFIVIVGGFCPANLPIVDVILIHIKSLRILCPEVVGEPPAKRFRQTLNLVAPNESSPLHPGREAGEHLLVMYGGWDALGSEYGGKEVNTLAVSADGSYVRWAQVDTLGQVPAPRYNHSAEIVREGGSLLVYGGEGLGVEANDTCCYTLSLDTLVWRRMPTFANFKRGGRKNHPKARCLHNSTVRVNPDTGAEEVVIWGGFTPAPGRIDRTQKNDMWPMTPYTLNLDTMVWTQHSQDDGKRPASRQRAAPLRIGPKKLLVVGGIAETGEFLDSIEQLNLETLKWEEPPLVLGQPSHGLRHVAGCTAAGLFVFGGTTTTIFGVTPITKLDVLQVGPPLELKHETKGKAKVNGTSPPRSPIVSPQQVSSFMDRAADFLTKLKLRAKLPGKGEWKLNTTQTMNHDVLARARAARASLDRGRDSPPSP